AEDGIRDSSVAGVQTCALPILSQAMFEARIEKYQTGGILGAANYKPNQIFRWAGFHPDSLGKDWGDLFSGNARAKQEAALTGSVDRKSVVEGSSRRNGGGGRRE